jgi:hypothetical protein
MYKNILIIGESNSVYKEGWIKGFELDGTCKITNFSIGSTGFFNIIRVLNKFQYGIENLEEYRFDLVIIDSFIQDSTFFFKDTLLYGKIINETLSSLRRKFQCNIAYIVFEPCEISKEIFNLKDTLLSACKNNSIFYFDVKRFLIEYCTNNNCTLKSVYQDSSHPKQSIASIAGLNFRYFLQKKYYETNESIHYEVPHKEGNLFYYFDLEDFGLSDDVYSKQLKNSLVSFESIVLKSKDPQNIKINLANSKVIPLGFFYNHGASRGFINLNGRNCLSKSIHNSSCNQDGILVFARPIHTIIFPKSDLTFDINIGHNEIFGKLELTENCNAFSINELSNSLFELISIIFVDLNILFKDDLNSWLLNKYTDMHQELNSSISHYRKLESIYYNEDNIKLKNIKELGLINKALNCNATQSSYYSDDFNNSNHGCNGIKTGSFSFHTSYEFNPFWIVDLGNILVIRAIVIYNRLDAGKDRIQKLRIFASINSIDWTHLYSHNSKLPFGGYDIECVIPPLVLEFENMSARYIKIDLNDTNYLHLDEVEIY